jgi:pyrroline-5-carboxylate reductase
MKMLVLGAGKMTEAILVGLKGKIDLSEVRIYSPSGVSAERLASLIGAQAITTFENESPDYVLLGCKPQQLVELKKNIGDRFKNCLFISMLAAIPEAEQLKVLGAKNLIRVMPNLAVRAGEGITLISSQSANSHLSKVQGMFQNLGEAPAVSESELEELTILTGSGPALFYEFAATLASSFSSLTPDARELLVRKVMSGATAVMNSQGNRSLEEHISAVTSKGGVTIAVLEAWRGMGFSKLLKDGVDQGKARSGELKKLVIQS